MQLLQKQNFHTHTTRCGHAEGTEREYVEAAISAGMTQLGFSDHAPYVFEGEYYSNFRMRPDKLEGYVQTVLDLKKEYAKDIQIHLGLEAEYYPRFFEAFLRLIEPYPIEYILQGQHFLKNEMERIYSGAETKDPEILRLYVDQVSEGMNTGKFACLAHSDLVHFTGDISVWRDEVKRLCENAKKANIPLEINMLGIRTNRHYPREDFWKIAGEVGNDVVIGSDAHAACDVCDQPSYDFAMEWVKKYNLNWHEASHILACAAR